MAGLFFRCCLSDYVLNMPRDGVNVLDREGKLVQKLEVPQGANPRFLATSVAVSKANELVLNSAKDFVVMDVETGKQLRAWQSKEHVQRFALDASGNVAASLHEFVTIYTPHGVLLTKFTLSHADTTKAKAFLAYVHSLCFDNDNRLLIGADCSQLFVLAFES